MKIEKNIKSRCVILLALTLAMTVSIQIVMADPAPGGIKDDNIAVARPAQNTISVNGAGSILTASQGEKLIPTGEVKSTFELNVQANGDTYKGNVKYHDGVMGFDVRSTNITQVLVYNGTYNVVRIAGTGTVNGVEGQPFYVTVSDADEPARDSDFFMITLPSIRGNPGEINQIYIPPWVIIPDPYEPPYDLIRPYTNYGYLSSGNIQVKITESIGEGVGIAGGKGGIGGDVSN